tara:strand:+ start:430 stop:1185 length:756 start_codon:yes stop_codon:yes gene_type:complete
MNILKLYRLRYQLIRQIFFIINAKIKLFYKIFFKKDKDTQKLINNGYIHLKSIIPLEFINYLENKYQKFDPKEQEVVCQRDLENKDLEKIFFYFNQNQIMDIVKDYLGKKIYSYQNVYHYLTETKSSVSSWQPHHDCKSNRLKAYIWISNNSSKTHPLYYLKKTNLTLKLWMDQNDSRFPKIDKKMDEIFGKPGDVIIFDTHGIHSNFKTGTEPRKTVITTFENIGIFSRINPFKKKGKDILKFHNGIYLN